MHEQFRGSNRPRMRYVIMRSGYPCIEQSICLSPKFSSESRKLSEVAYTKFPYENDPYSPIGFIKHPPLLSPPSPFTRFPVKEICCTNPKKKRLRTRTRKHSIIKNVRLEHSSSSKRVVRSNIWSIQTLDIPTKIGTKRKEQDQDGPQCSIHKDVMAQLLS